MCVHIIVYNCCTSYPPDNHHSSDDVYRRGGGGQQLLRFQVWFHTAQKPMPISASRDTRNQDRRHNAAYVIKMSWQSPSKGCDQCSAFPSTLWRCWPGHGKGIQRIINLCHLSTEVLIQEEEKPRENRFGNGRFPDNHFPGQDVSRTSACPDLSIISRTRCFPDNHFPRQTFPGQFV